MEFHCGEIQIARRAPYQENAFLYLRWAIAEDDEWLLWSNFEPIPSYWYRQSYDDGGWEETEIDELESENGVMYIRKHFISNDVNATRLGVIVRASSGVVLYLNGKMVWRSNVSSGCSQSKCAFMSTHHFIEPYVSSFIVPISPSEDSVFAVQLVGKQSTLHRFSFHMTAFSIISPILLSSPAFPPTQSPSVLNVFFCFSFHYRTTWILRLLCLHLLLITMVHQPSLLLFTSNFLILLRSRALFSTPVPSISYNNRHG